LTKEGIVMTREKLTPEIRQEPPQEPTKADKQSKLYQEAEKRIEYRHGAPKRRKI